MKKIFAISVLSVMAVVGTTNAWADTPLRNYNLATVNYVEDLVDEMIITTGTTPTINKDNLVPSFARSEDLIQEAIISTTETASNKDAQAPTIARMEAAIANDTSGLVDKAQVIKSDDKALSDGTTDLSSANADEIVPTVANVEANFAPRIADAVYNGSFESMYTGVTEIDSSDPSDLPRGEYSVIVSVDDSGNVSFRWVPIQTTDCTSTVGSTCPPA